MAFHHLALATTDLAATHRFYTEAMGFALVLVEDGATEVPGGWFRHALYDTGDGTLMAFMELHDERCRRLRPRHLAWPRPPGWVNHIAFGVDDLDALDAGAGALVAHCGHDVVRMEHSLGTSIYTEDPNGNTVEWVVRHPCVQPRRNGPPPRRRLVADDLPRDRARPTWSSSSPSTTHSEMDALPAPG